MLPFAFTPGPVEIIIVLLIVLLLFGAKRLPELGRSLGTGMREFKSSVTGKNSDDHEQSAQIETQSTAADETQSSAADGATAKPDQPEPAPAERAGTAGQTRS
jgi:sec-independent protein translocase protein TatA